MDSVLVLPSKNCTEVLGLKWSQNKPSKIAAAAPEGGT